MALGTLTIDLKANTASLESDLGKANRIAEQQLERARKIGSQIGTVIGSVAGALASGAFANWIKQSIDIADNANDMAQAIGISVESFTALQYAAEHEGIAVEALSASMGKFNKNISAAAAGSKKQAQAFSDIGVSVKDAQGNIKSTDQLFLEVADRLSGYADGANKAAVAQDLFGKSASALMPLLNSGADGISQLTEQARELGLVFSQEDADAAGQFNDSLFVMQSATRGVANNVSKGLLPGLNDLTGLMMDLAKDTDAANTASEVITGTLKGLATVAIVIGAAFKTTGSAIGAVASALTQAAQGDMQGAWETIKNGATDYMDTTESAIARINKLWTGEFREAGKSAAETTGTVRQALERTNVETEKHEKAVKKTSDAIDNQVKSLQQQAATLGMNQQQATLYKLAMQGASDSQLQAARTALQSISAFEQQNALLEQQTAMLQRWSTSDQSYWTEQERALARYQERIGVLGEELAYGQITQAQYNAELAKAKTAYDEAGKGAEGMFDEFAKSAAQNIQTQIADTLVNGFDNGASGILKSWGQLIQNMIAQAVAADLAKRMFGADFASGKEGASIGGWIGSAASWASSLFGGGKAVGGPVMSGKIYEVGENNQPEMFRSNGRQYLIPGNSGSVTPGAGGNTVHATFYIGGDTDSKSARKAANTIKRELNGLIVSTGRSA